MPDLTVRVALYLNQFFGQVGGEEAAGIGPRLVRDPAGSGRALVSHLGAGEELVGTVICGDNAFAERPEQVTDGILDLLRSLSPDIFLAGPAYNAGRYGVACGALCRDVAADLGIAAVTAMFRENPGVDLYRRHVVILETGENARTMAADLGRMLSLGRRLRDGLPPGRPHEVGYFSHGIVVPELAADTAATRAVDLLLAKVSGQPYHSEVELPPSFARVPPAPPVADLTTATVALVTDGGLVPLGNPDGIESRAATKFGVYDIEELDHLEAADYEVSHGGYDTGFVKADPNRLVPVDAARDMEREGHIGRLYRNFLVTTGLANPLENSRRLGREMADYLKAAGVDAVILTST
jgi:glycine reductase